MTRTLMIVDATHCPIQRQVYGWLTYSLTPTLHKGNYITVLYYNARNLIHKIDELGANCL